VDEPVKQPDELERVRCTSCGADLDEAEAQAQRWGYWRIGSGIELYPFCPGCAARAFQPDTDP
jgi:hypothetical protein